MNLITLCKIITLIVILLFVIGFLYASHKEISIKILRKKIKKNPAILQKTIKKHNNRTGDNSYYTFEIPHITNINMSEYKWHVYDDVKYLYDNISSIPEPLYLDNGKTAYLITLNVDGRNIKFVLPPDEYTIRNSYYNDYEVYTILRDWESAYCPLNVFCKRVIKHIDEKTYDEEVVLTNTNEETKQMYKETEVAIQNNDIKELKRIVQEYKDTVEVSRSITKALLAMK